MIEKILGEPVNFSVVIKNTGNQEITIVLVHGLSSDISVAIETKTLTLGPGEQTTVETVFTPTTVGTFTALARAILNGELIAELIIPNSVVVIELLHVVGQVTDSSTGIGISNVNLNFVGPTVKSTQTDVLGNYLIEGLLAGDYGIELSHPDYIDKTVPVLITTSIEINMNMSPIVTPPQTFFESCDAGNLRNWGGGGFSDVDNVFRRSGNGWQNIYRANATFAPVFDFECTISPAGPSGANSTFRAIFASQGTGRNSQGYYLEIRSNLSIRVLKDIGTGLIELITASTIPQSGVPVRLRVIRDSTGLMTLFVNGVEEGTPVIDTSFNSSTHFVIASDSQNAFIDDIVLGIF